MGLRFRRRSGGWHGGNEDERRFKAYFPRAFAYAYANLGDDVAGREVVGEAFSDVLAAHIRRDEDSFRVALFSTLHNICRERKRKMPLDIGLGHAEREVVTLTFDAGLPTTEVDAVLGTNDSAVNLSSALQKMLDLSSPSIIPSFFRLP